RAARPSDGCRSPAHRRCRRRADHRLGPRGALLDRQRAVRGSQVDGDHDEHHRSRRALSADHREDGLTAHRDVRRASAARPRPAHGAPPGLASPLLALRPRPLLELLAQIPCLLCPALVLRQFVLIRSGAGLVALGRLAPKLLLPQLLRLVLLVHTRKRSAGTPSAPYAANGP